MIERVSHSDWATPIVITYKPTGKGRICGDFISKDNQYLNWMASLSHFQKNSSISKIKVVKILLK